MTKETVDINVINLINEMRTELGSKIDAQGLKISAEIKASIGEHEKRLRKVEDYQVKIKNTLIIIGVAVAGIMSILGLMFK